MARCLAGLWTALVLVLLLADTAAAQPENTGASSSARALANEADSLWNQGHYNAAADRFRRAYELIKAPPLRVRQAECLVKLGRLIEASELYVAVARMKIAEDAPEPYRRAVEIAGREGAALLAKLPNIVITVQGENLEGIEIKLDGKPLDAALIGAKHPVNPGQHRIEARLGSLRATATITASEGDSEGVVLDLQAPEDDAATVAPIDSVPRDERPSTKGASQRMWGWVGIGAGAAGIVVGSAAGGIALRKKSALDDACPNAKCPPESSGDVDLYNTSKTLATVGFAVGGVGLITGAVLLLTAPSNEPETQSRIRPWVSVGSAGVEGVF